MNAIDPEGRQAVPYVFGWVSYDASIPDPLDGAWPKWAIYGALLCVAGGYDYMFAEEDTQQVYMARKGGKKGKGERGFAGSADGTNNPGKNIKKTANKPGYVIYIHPQTGKKILKKEKKAVLIVQFLRKIIS